MKSPPDFQDWTAALGCSPSLPWGTPHPAGSPASLLPLPSLSPFWWLERDPPDLGSAGCRLPRSELFHLRSFSLSSLGRREWKLSSIQTFRRTKKKKNYDIQIARVSRDRGAWYSRIRARSKRGVNVQVQREKCIPSSFQAFAMHKTLKGKYQKIEDETGLREILRSLCRPPPSMKTISKSSQMAVLFLKLSRKGDSATSSETHSSISCCPLPEHFFPPWEPSETKKTLSPRWRDLWLFLSRISPHGAYKDTPSYG